MKCAHDLVPLLVERTSVERYPGNAKLHDLDTIAASLERFGYWRAIVVQESTGYVLVGNGQHEAAEKLGWDQVPVIRMDIGDDDARRIVLMDNRAGEKGGGYDEQARAELLRLVENAADGDGLDGSGYDTDDYRDILAKLADTALDDDGLDEGDADTDTYTPVWGVIINCDTELEQAELIDQLQARGLRVKAMMS